jgi:hypothetical protein
VSPPISTGAVCFPLSVSIASMRAGPGSLLSSRLMALAPGHNHLYPPKTRISAGSLPHLGTPRQNTFNATENVEVRAPATVGMRTLAIWRDQFSGSTPQRADNVRGGAECREFSLGFSSRGEYFS